MPNNQNPANPIAIIVAPNGARKQRGDHPALPLTPAQMADCAEQCLAAGATMLHMHARDENGQHTLDPAINGEFVRAVEQRVGDGLLVQVTTEAVGRYSPAQQMALVRALRPKATSIALREIFANASEHATVTEFLYWAQEHGVVVQFIVYSLAELQRFNALLADGSIPPRGHHLLLVFGRDHTVKDADLATLLAQVNNVRWCVCGFGPLEYAMGSQAVARGGDVRVGFENNVLASDGTPAHDNAQLAQQMVALAQQAGRRVLTGRELYGALA